MRYYIADPNGRIVTAPPVGSGAFNFFTNSAAPIGIAPSVGDEKTIVEFAAHLVGAPYGAVVAGFSPRPFPTGFADFPNGFTLIGSSGIATAPANGGFLLLAVNDVDNTADNGGSFAAEISQVPESGTPELSRLWGYSEDVIRGWFLERPRPGVLRHSVHKRGKREYVSLRISESAAAAMYAEKSGYEKRKDINHE